MRETSKPSNYGFLKNLRKSKTASLKPCKYLKPTTKLRSYQAIGAVHLISLTRMILGDGAGLGKTLQTIAAYVYCLEKNPTLKLVVVAPKSAMDQWAEEIEKFTVGIKVHVLRNKYAKDRKSEVYGTKKELAEKGLPSKYIYGFQARKAQYDTIDAHVLIVNYNAVMNDYLFIAENRGNNYMVVFDEIQAIKNEKSRTNFGADILSKSASRVYGLSATLIKNRLEEAYCIYNVVVPGLFPSKKLFYEKYTRRKKMKVGRGKKTRYFYKVTGYKNLDLFKDTIDPFFLIRRTREVANELPSLISKKVILEMESIQKKLYQQALSGELYRRIVRDKYFEHKEKVESMDEPSDRALKILEKLQRVYDESFTEDALIKNKLAALSYCQLVSNGPGWIKEEGESSKEIEFKRLFEEELFSDKVIIFTRFKSGIKRLEEILDGLDINHVRITGDEDDAARKSARLDFQDDEKNVNVIFITQAGSAALNLQKANIILFYDTPWSYGDLYQTIGRAQRIGSLFEHIHLIHMVNKNTIDDHVIEVLDTKKDLISKIMGDIAEGAIEFKDNEMTLKDDEGSVEAIFTSVFGSKHL